MRFLSVFSLLCGWWVGSLLMATTHPAHAQPAHRWSTVPQDAAMWTREPPRFSVERPRSGGRRYLQSLGGGLLGVGVGGGLGMLIGNVVVEERYSLRGEDPQEVPAPVFGVWIGSIVGAMAGQRAAMEDNVIGLTVAGSFFGSVLTAGFLAILSDGDPYWAASGFAVGAAAGAALGTTVAAPPSSRGFVTWQEGTFRPTLPTVRSARMPFSSRGATSVVIVALHF